MPITLAFCDHEYTCKRRLNFRVYSDSVAVINYLKAGFQILLGVEDRRGTYT